MSSTSIPTTTGPALMERKATPSSTQGLSSDRGNLFSRLHISRVLTLHWLFLIPLAVLLAIYALFFRAYGAVFKGTHIASGAVLAIKQCPNLGPARDSIQK